MGSISYTRLHLREMIHGINPHIIDVSCVKAYHSFFAAAAWHALNKEVLEKFENLCYAMAKR